MLRWIYILNMLNIVTKHSFHLYKTRMIYLTSKFSNIDFSWHDCREIRLAILMMTLRYSLYTIELAKTCLSVRYSYVRASLANRSFERLTRLWWIEHSSKILPWTGESSSSGQFFQLSFHNLKLFQSNLFWIDPNRELRKIFENQILKNETSDLDFNWSTGMLSYLIQDSTDKLRPGFLQSASVDTWSNHVFDWFLWI